MPASEPVTVAVCDSGSDRYRDMLVACRAWIEEYHPESLGMAVYVWVDETLPPIRVTIPVSAF